MFVVNNQNKVTLLDKTPIEIEMTITPIVPADLISQVTLSKAVNKNTTGKDPIDAARKRIDKLTEDQVKISERIKQVQADQKKHFDARRSTVSQLLKPGAKAVLEIPHTQMVQHGMWPETTHPTNTGCARHMTIVLVILW